VEVLNYNNFRKENLKTSLENLHGYLGYFDSDPNRVLDLLLLGLAMNSSVSEEVLEGYVEMIRHFKVSAIPHLLGYKL
jgi:hypothetical protein